MMRGTTPTLKFKLPVDAEWLDVLYITFQEEGKTIFEKKLEDCEKHGEYVHLRLTQEDTLKFSNDVVVDIQLRGRTKSNDAIACRVIHTCAERILKEGVI